MAQIQPITVWTNGGDVQANNFTLRSIGDNLSLEPTQGQATLYYELQVITVNEDLTETTNTVLTATLEIAGADYASWNNDPTSNAWVYNWAAAKLNLVFVTPVTMVAPVETK